LGGITARWRENPYWQFFSGETYFSHDLPIDPSSLTRWRKRIGKEGSEKILALTIQAGIRTQVIRKPDIKRVIVDTTVQEKNIAFPRDSQLYLTALKALTQLAKDNGILLRQTYARKAKALSF
jgi:IS5 family transposase